MSGACACKCARPVRKRCFVIDRECNYSAFSGYHFTPSKYSCVVCRDCRSVWRTRAAYVRQLPDIDRELYVKTREIRAKGKSNDG